MNQATGGGLGNFFNHRCKSFILRKNITSQQLIETSENDFKDTFRGQSIRFEDVNLNKMGPNISI